MLDYGGLGGGVLYCPQSLGFYTHELGVFIPIFSGPESGIIRGYIFSQRFTADRWQSRIPSQVYLPLIPCLPMIAARLGVRPWNQTMVV